MCVWLMRVFVLFCDTHGVCIFHSDFGTKGDQSIDDTRCFYGVLILLDA